MVYIHAALQDREESVDRFLRALLGVPEAPSEEECEASCERAFEFFKRQGEINAAKAKNRKGSEPWE